MPIPCKWIESSLNQYIDGDLNPAKRMLVSKHLKRCGQCKAVADELTAAREAVRKIQSGIEAPPYLREMVAQKIAARSQSRFYTRRRGKWFFSPEFSWGVATVLILSILIGYLGFIKPDVSACNLITTIQADAQGRPHVSDMSAVLNYFGKDDGNLLETISVTVQNNDCKGKDALILHMTIKKNNEILVYTHGGSADIKSAEGAGALLKKTNIDGREFYVGDFVGVKVVYWNLKGQPYAMAIKEA